ncbi:MAG: hypothetical protein FWG09_06995 [Synergistaceae bacterium]|nr:hypothetical protein [Synergistaceae bacterium]
MPADEGRNRRNMLEEDGDSAASPIVTPAPKKRKSRSRLKTFFFLILLTAGVITGLHHSGFIDVRPFIWNTVPKIPFAGDFLKEHLNIPEVYTLTVEERRKLELRQWQERLDLKERELQAKLDQSESLSNDISARMQKMDKRETDLSAQESNVKAKGDATPEEEALMKELTDTYQEMAPSKSAKIMAQLPDHLAVDLLRKLPQDARASILAKMEPRKAARITESLANPQ